MQRYTVVAWVAAALMAAAVSFSVLRIPIQIPDSLVVMLQVQAAPSAALTNFVGEQGFLRPVYMSQTRALLDAAGGMHYFLVFRGFHVVLVALLFILFVRAARVRTAGDAAALLFALVVLTGHHTFRGNVWESYPVNHYLEIAVLCLGALVVAQSRGGWWADLFAGVLFAAAALTLESGLLVWVVLVAARLAGLRGVSGKGLALVSVLLVAYLYVRFVYLSTGMPELEDRATGFGFGRLERSEVPLRFGDAPYILYAYNVISSFLSVLLSEPRSGTWDITRRLVSGDVTPSVVVSVLSSLCGLAVLVWFVAGRATMWRAGKFEHGDQLVAVFAAVLVVNAAICYAYTKDEIMSTAGAFYALAVFAATRSGLARLAGISLRPVAAGVLTLVVLLGSAAWAVRAVGLHYQMYYSAYYLRNEWVTVDDWLREQHVEPSMQGRQLVATLRELAIDMPGSNPHFLPRWTARWFE